MLFSHYVAVPVGISGSNVIILEKNYGTAADATECVNYIRYREPQIGLPSNQT